LRNANHLKVLNYSSTILLFREFKITLKHIFLEYSLRKTFNIATTVILCIFGIVIMFVWTAGLVPDSNVMFSGFNFCGIPSYLFFENTDFF
jgi:hypothetical protein